MLVQRPIIVFVTIIICISPLYAGAFDVTWGIGMIIPAEVAPPPGEGDFSYWPEGIQFPQVPIPVFERPHGKRIGKLFRTTDWNTTYRIDIFLSLVAHTDELPIHVNRTLDPEFIRSGYGEYCLKIYRQQDGYVQVLRDVYGENAWIRAADVQLTGFLVIDYLRWLVREGKTTGLTPVLPDSGITLREHPDFSSRRILRIPAEEAFYFDIEFSGRIDGTWAEVIVKYSTERCGDAAENPLYPDTTRFSGWIKVIDQQGFPNIWYDTWGC